MTKKYTIKYNKAKCISATSCIQIAPETWELDEDGIAKPKKLTITEEELEKNIEAAKSCPTHAIEIFDENDKKIV